MPWTAFALNGELARAGMPPRAALLHRHFGEEGLQSSLQHLKW